MPGVHYELQRGTDAQAVAYCQKEDTRLTGGLSFQSGYARPLRKMLLADMRAQQIVVIDHFWQICHWACRKIWWFWEPDGSWGKTQMSKYFLDNRKCTVVSGKNNDCIYAVAEYIEENGEGPEIIIFDVPRANCGTISYQAAEKLKDGLAFSSKYKSLILRFNTPHVLIFANEPPETNRFSADRWNIVQLPAYDGPTYAA